MNFGKIKLLSSSIVYGCDSYESDLFDHLKKEFIQQEKEMIDVLKSEGSK